MGEDIEAQLIGGPEKVSIRVVDYDPAWPARFEALRGRIQCALGERAERIEHIGSTSVPGLPAKPIIDMLIVVHDVRDEDAYVAPLVEAGFALRVREPGHRMLRTPERDAHLHCFEADDPAIEDYLDLRQRLRTVEGDRALYARTKQRLATQDWDSMVDYAEAKTDVISQILARARGRKH